MTKLVSASEAGIASFALGCLKRISTNIKTYAPTAAFYAATFKNTPNDDTDAAALPSIRLQPRLSNERNQ